MDEKLLHILIVEDSASDAGLVARHIERSGYEVCWARVEGAAALKAAVEQTTWDVILCDYSMPDFNGLDALTLVRATVRDVPFIFVSGTMGEDTAVKAMKAGAQDYVVKGRLERLVPAIERELSEAKVRGQERLLESDRQHLVEELQRALAQVQRLSGPLPICSHCCRIRDGQGRWQRIEIYIEEHSEARFKHRLCPDCRERLDAASAMEDLLGE